MDAIAGDIVVEGGPKGAGKTTAAATLLPNSLAITEFVNADEMREEFRQTT
jgi:predicted ABC-type ATPase